LILLFRIAFLPIRYFSLADTAGTMAAILILRQFSQRIAFLDPNAQS